MSDQADIQQNITVGDTPGAPNGTVAPTAGSSATVQARSRLEYVAGRGHAWIANYAQSLPHYIDDITRDFGHDLYDRMAQDPVIESSLTVFKASVLEEGVQLAPALDDASADGYELARDICAFCTFAFGELTTSLDATLWGLLDAIAYGNKVAEATYKADVTYTGRQRLTLRDIKVKPRASTAFVVDSFWNILGLAATIPGVSLPVQTGTILALDNPALQPNLLPREKFAIYSFRPKDGDPRGTSILRSAYTPWWHKMQAMLEWLKWLAQFASPSVIGYTAPGAVAEPERDAAGNVVGPAVSPEQKMINLLTQLRNGSALAFPDGYKVDWLFSSGEGQAFLRAMEYYDGQMVLAILTQRLATQEAQHGTRAQGQVHQDVLGTIIRQAKREVVRVLRQDVLRQLVRLNWGDRALPLVPKVSLGSVERTDFADTANAIAALTRVSYLDPSQYPAVDLLLNLPPRATPITPDDDADDNETEEPDDDEPREDGPKQESRKTSGTSGALPLDAAAAGK